MIMATRCLATQSAGRPLPPAFTSTNDFSISGIGGGDLLTTTGPTGRTKQIEEKEIDQKLKKKKHNLHSYKNSSKYSNLREK